MGTSQNCLDEGVLTSTHNLCFEAKIRNIGIPLHTPVLLHKSGVQGGSCHGHFRDGTHLSYFLSIDLSEI